MRTKYAYMTSWELLVELRHQVGKGQVDEHLYREIAIRLEDKI